MAFGTGWSWKRLCLSILPQRLERRKVTYEGDAMLAAGEALGLILNSVRPSSEEIIPLAASLFRHLAASVTAPIDLPRFDNAAMDGFAVRALDTQQASDAHPLPLKVIRTVAAGDAGGRCLMPLPAGRAVRIMTGAPVPEGADAVIPFEDAPGEEIRQPADTGDHIRRAGEDVAAGAKLFETGERITPRTIALLAALGLCQVTVFRKPRVCLLSTGNEIRPAGETLQPGQIYNSNGPALMAALAELGIDGEMIGVAVDTEESLRDALSQIEDTDVLITVGGVSAGDFDLVPKVLKDIGAEVVFHKVAIKPGKPLLYAIRGKTHVFALPGNPVSALMVFDRFVRPALLKMMGARHFKRTLHEAVAVEPLKGASGKEVYLRGLVSSENGRFVARSAGAQGSAMLGSLARANAVLIVPAARKAIAAGESLSFEFLGGEL